MKVSCSDDGVDILYLLNSVTLFMLYKTANNLFVSIDNFSVFAG